MFVLLWRLNNRFGAASWPQTKQEFKPPFESLRPVNCESMGKSLWQMRAGGYVAVHGFTLEWKFSKISAMLAAMPPRLVTMCSEAEVPTLTAEAAPSAGSPVLTAEAAADATIELALMLQQPEATSSTLGKDKTMWAEMSESEQVAARILGFAAASWEEGLTPESSFLPFGDRGRRRVRQLRSRLQRGDLGCGAVGCKGRRGGGRAGRRSRGRAAGRGHMGGGVAADARRSAPPRCLRARPRAVGRPRAAGGARRAP